ncbi:glycosyltransferase family 4 protein [Streptomyces sp. 4F14]|uniref:glycosyltransferase family 4 protein n=1 Tax=Streptomyces sp. 4F14 TaxID=3394380 RepID=UPI003A8A0508
MSPTRILTGIDLPAGPSCGSMILAADTYRATPDTRTTFLPLPPVDPAWHHPFDRLHTLRTTKQPYGTPQFATYIDELTAEVEELITRRRPDVIHAQQLGFGLSPALTRAAAGIPVISIAHGTDVLAATHLEQACDTLTEVVTASAFVVAPNSTLAERIAHLTHHRHTDRITTIPWGIPTAHAHVRHRPHDSNSPLSLLHAGRLDENKSTVTAIQALALTRRPHRLTVIGSGPELTHLTDTAHDLGVSDCVTFEPFLPREELWRRFPDFDAFVFTTAELEAFGLVAIEAQAHGLPVVYSDLPGMGVTLAQAGNPYTPGAPDSLAAAIDQLAHDTHWRDALIRADLDNARRYDIAATAGQLAALTTRAANSSRT